MTQWSSFALSLLIVFITSLNSLANEPSAYQVKGDDKVRTLVYGNADGETFEFNIHRSSQEELQKYTYSALLSHPLLVQFSNRLREVAKTNPGKAVEMLSMSRNTLGKAAGIGKKFAKGVWKFSAIDFPAEALGFYGAQFAIVLRKLAIQASWDGPPDPAALVSFWHHVTSPAGIVGFYGFMTGSLLTRQSLMGLIHLAATMNGLTVQTVGVAGRPKMIWRRDANGKMVKGPTSGVRLQAKIANLDFVKNAYHPYAQVAQKLGKGLRIGTNVSARGLAAFIMKFQPFFFQHATMGVGMMFSTVIEELWHDEDVTKCAELSLKLEILEEAQKPTKEKDEHDVIRICEKAYAKWTGSEKIWDFTPHFLSLMAAVVVNANAVMPAVSATGKLMKKGTGFSVRKVGGKRVYVVALKYLRMGFRTAGKVGSKAFKFWPYGGGLVTKGSQVMWSLFWLMGTAEVLDKLFVVPAQVIRHNWKNLSEDVDAKLEEAVQKEWSVKDIQKPADPNCQRMGGWWSALFNVGKTIFGYGCDNNNEDTAKDLLSSLKRRSTRMKKYRDMRLMAFNSAVGGWQTYTGNLLNVGFAALKAYPAVALHADAENQIIVEDAKNKVLGTNKAQSRYGYTPATLADYYAGIEVESFDQLSEDERKSANKTKLAHKHIAEHMLKLIRVHLVESNKLTELFKSHGFAKVASMSYHDQLVLLWNTLQKTMTSRERPTPAEVRIQQKFITGALNRSAFGNTMLAQLAIYFYLTAADQNLKLEDNPLVPYLKNFDPKYKLYTEYKNENVTRKNLVITGLRVLRGILSIMPPYYPDTYPLPWRRDSDVWRNYRTLDVHGGFHSAEGHIDEELLAVEQEKMEKTNPFYALWLKIGQPWPLEPGERFILKMDRELVDPTGTVRQGGLFATENDNALTPTLSEHLLAGMTCGHNYSLPQIVSSSTSWYRYVTKSFQWFLEKVGAVQDRSADREIRQTLDRAVQVDIKRHIDVGDYKTALSLIHNIRATREYEIIWDNFKGMYGLMEKFQPHRMTNTSFNPCDAADYQARGHELHSKDGKQKFFGLFDVIRHRLDDRYKSRESFEKESEQMTFAVEAAYQSYRTEFANIVRKHFFEPYNDDRFFRLRAGEGGTTEKQHNNGLGWLQRYGQFWGKQYRNVFEWWYNIEIVPLSDVQSRKTRNRLSEDEIKRIKSNFAPISAKLESAFSNPLNNRTPPEQKAVQIVPYDTTEYTAAGIRDNLMQEFLFLMKVLDALAVSYSQSKDNPEEQFLAYERAKAGLRIQFGRMLDSLNREDTTHHFQTLFASSFKTFHGLAGFFNPHFADNPQQGFEEASKDETSMKKISAILFSLENQEKKEYKTRSISFVLDQIKALMLEANQYHALTETIQRPQ